ncbi:MAG: hypothetical protein UV48_C0003G0007 [Candidatus Azambacteria bacterium GW2011_GWA2_42_9]|uniref:Uncharacterized protein n=3 Tax=Candidatus Azamiibacteriota TaxID=1752741 RepID=A0A0G0ZCK3_9BACT|nr:MAG: hypothetical protein UV07_C0005G0029 [Candidatus Azambacteria bacterium GW2011_GWB1_42_17]KKS46399.1 MAG: hypothetical protein UV10_C0003G0028 [Candidatus Azambacteria bacterium GW2011_GWA1_42_19]KKS75996.1 MAG: hypothetical protein UV48_C0003G0007 [Candidatus Azambacteria bacterium GW2011_GWA2_42_9]KKS88759.1 MAG: hypothetical protein UV62_C0002G0007 [Parcubacteria group bacterium GW2011_GWC1_43_11]
MSNYMDASFYLVNINPYFLAALAIAFILGIVSIWSNHSLIFKLTALITIGVMVWFTLNAFNKTNDKINYVIKETNAKIKYLEKSLLSKPKIVTYEELQGMIPEGHPGHLVLYGEAAEEGIYLLLRSPGISEPRYYLMGASDKLKEQFKDAEFNAQKKQTQLFLGGKIKGEKNKEQREGINGQGTQKSEGGLGVFHPAPVTGDGPSKPR